MKQEQTARQLERLCGAFRARLKSMLLLAGLGRVIALAIVLLLLFAAADWRAHLQTPVRLVFLALFLAGICVTAWFTLIRPLGRPWSNREVLSFLDANVPAADGMLLELYELSTARVLIQEVATPLGAQMADAAEMGLQPLATEVRGAAAVRGGAAGRWTIGAAAGVLVLVGIAVLAPEHAMAGLQRFFNPFSNARWPSRTHIQVAEPSTGWTVPQLESFTVNAEVTDEVPPRVVLAYRTRSADYWVREKIRVEQVAAEDGRPGRHTVQYVFPEVREPLEFYIEGGDYETDRYRIDIIQRPYLTKITAHYKYPAYAGIPDTTLTSGQLAGLEGTQVGLEFESSMPLDRAVFVLDESGGKPAEAAPVPATETAAAAEAPEAGDGAPAASALPADAKRIELAKASDTKFTTSLMLEQNGRYAVELYEKNGYREARPEIYEIRVQPDNPPEVELLSPGSDLVETNQASVQVAFKARDEFGLAKVQFLYQLDGGEPKVLGDHITGPLQQTGLASSAQFTWALRQMEDLPDAGMLTYFVRVHDNNPTGRGVVQTPPRQIQIVKGSEFHLQAVMRAKLMEEEARICWRNQLHAWLRGGEWLATGTGEEADPLWVEMRDKQEVAFTAAKQVQYHLQVLTEKYQRNQMAQDFMAGRLSVIAELVNGLIDKEHAAIAAALDQAKPRTEADAKPDRQKGLRGSALAKCRDDQKMSVLICERLLRKLYDWRDLQDCAIKTKLLYERQEEVLKLTHEIAPKFIGNLMVDLTDEDQGKLLTLGKQQRAIFDTETQLESSLTYLEYKAQQQNRKSIRDPLRTAWANLRQERVNDYLKRAAMLIEDNQPDQVFDDQLKAIRALKVVQAGLVVAGQKVDPDEPLTLAMDVTAEKDLDPDLTKPESRPADDEQPTEDGTGQQTPVPADWREYIPELTVGLSPAIRLTVEMQDNVHARSVYLAANSSEKEMPRFIRLKLLRLQERQAEALTAGLDESIKQAANEKEVGAGQILQYVREEFVQSQQLLAAGRVDPTTQQLQADAKATLEDLLQHLAFKKKVDDAIAENKRLGGVDAFNRKYVLHDSDLELAVEAVGQIDFALQFERDVIRKLERFAAAPAAGEPAAKIEVANRARAAASQKKVSDTLDAVANNAAKGFSKDVAEPIASTGVTTMGELKVGQHAARIAAGKEDPAVLAALGDAEKALYTVETSLRALLEARVQPKPKAVAEPIAPTSRQFAEQFDPAHIAEQIKQNDTLDPQLKALMLRSLERDFPVKYRRLLAAYYASFIKQEEGRNVATDQEPTE